MYMIKGILLAFIAALAFPSFASQTATGSLDLIAEHQSIPDKAVTQNTKIAKLMKLAELMPAKSDAPVVRTAAILLSIAHTNEALNYSGNGDVTYWMRTSVDFARTARAIGHATLSIAVRIHNGPLHAALVSTANQLIEIQAGTRGDVNYWMQRSQDISLQVKTATDQIVFLANKLEAEEVHTHTALRSLTMIMTSTDFRGVGDHEYWARVTRNIALLSHKCAKSLELLSNGTPDPLYSVLNSYVTQLMKISSAGDGDAEYWMQRAKIASTQLDDIGTSILMISKKV